MGKLLIDLIGKKFERLIVLERAKHGSRHDTSWLCLCDCGNKKNIGGSALKSGNTKSCGCLAAENRRKYNEGRKILPPDAYKMPKSKRRQTYLPDSYIKKLMTQYSDVLEVSDIPPELVALKREEMKLKRLIKEKA